MEYKSKYYKENREKILNKKKMEYKDKKEILNQRSKKYKENNKEKYLEQAKNYQKEYRRKNKEKIKLSKKEYNKRPEVKEKIKEYRKEYMKQYTKEYESNPKNKLKKNLKNRLRIAIKSQSTIKKGKTFELLGCTGEEAFKYIESLFQKGMSWDNYGEWHIDHIIPCSLFDLKNSEEQEICFHYTNLQPLWSEDNLSKGDKLIFKT